MSAIKAFLFDAGSQSSRLDAILMVACLLIALGLRLVVIISEPQELTRDRDAYLGIATSLAEGRGFSTPNSSSPTAFRPPLYPVCLAIGLRRLPTTVTVAGINLLAGLMTVWLTAQAGKNLQLGRLRFVAALLVAIDPLLLQYSSRPMTESLCTALAILWLWSVTTVPPPGKSQHPVWGLVSGVAFGLLVLSRPTFWAMAGCCGLIWLIGQWRRVESDKACRARLFWQGLWSAGGTVITVAPWLIRNAIVFGTPILTTTHGGYTLLLGNNPVFYEEVVRQPWGTTWPDASQHKWEADLEAQLLHDLGPNPSELQRDAWQSRQAKSFIAADPWGCAQAAIHRLRSLWNTVPQGDAATGVNSGALKVVGWYYSLVLTAGLLGMISVLTQADRNRWLWLYVLIVSVQIVHLFYWTNARMRAPLTPAIALFAVAVIPHNPSRWNITSIKPKSA